MKIMVFYSPICSSCPEAIKVVREVVEEYEVKIKEINILSPEGQEKAEEYKVKSTPSIFINQTNILGVPTKERLKIAIEKELAR